MNLTLGNWPSKHLILLSSGRAIKNALSKLPSNATGFLPKLSTIGDFFSNLYDFDNRKMIDDISRHALLYHAYLDADKTAKLGFEKEFLRFLSSSDFLDKFFSELNGELVELDDIESSDTYAEFADHLEILKQISSNYKNTLRARGLFDKKYEQPNGHNQLYLDLFDAIDVHLEGYPTNQELETLAQISLTKPVKIYFHKNRFTNKLVEKMLALDIDLHNAEYGYYEIDLSSKQFTQLESPKQILPIQFATFSERFHQVGYVFWMIEYYISIGVAAENICVVLPDESFVPLLQSLDKMRNLNFAMGHKLKSTPFANKLIASREYICHDSDLSAAKLKHYGYLDAAKSFSSIDKLLKDLDYEKEIDLVDIIEDELRKLKNTAILDEYDQKTALWLFVESILNRSIDDVGGGKVTVMGTLETRGCDFEAVIIVDFNEQKVPKPEEKDLFLNTKIRSRCALPTPNDREDLQSYYYHRLFENAKYVSACAVKNERENPSGILRFFETVQANFDDSNALSVLAKLVSHSPKMLIATNTDTNRYKITKLSASSLKDLLTCKRRYYLKYIKSLREHNDDELKTSEMGTLFHNIAANVFANDELPISTEAISLKFEQEAKKAITNRNLAEYEFEARLMLSKLDDFFAFEVDRLSSLKPELLEKRFAFTLGGIEFTGSIDRVDMDRNGMYHVLDYKLKENIKVDSKKKITTKPEDITDFQIPIYVIAIANIFGNNVDEFVSKHLGIAAFYDIYKAQIIPEEGVLEKITLLQKILSTISGSEFGVDDFTLCEKKSNCTHCSYKEICGR